MPQYTEQEAFQSTRPRGARRAPCPRWHSGGRVSIHAPAWGATALSADGGIRIPGFNPRARVGRDTLRRRGMCWTKVSIHAPAWGATCLRKFPSCLAWVSIHAPAWGATFIQSAHGDAVTGFNPRARVGRDTAGDGRRRPAGVSIHAPAWGATESCFSASCRVAFQSTRPRGARLLSLQKTCRASKFQSTRPRGARHFFPLRASRPTQFQSTRPRGARRYQRRYHARHTRFNPRARVGRDGNAAGHGRGTGAVSIHAPAWGATRSPCRPQS